MEILGASSECVLFDKLYLQVQSAVVLNQRCDQSFRHAQQLDGSTSLGLQWLNLLRVQSDPLELSILIYDFSTQFEGEHLDFRISYRLVFSHRRIGCLLSLRDGSCSLTLRWLYRLAWRVSAVQGTLRVLTLDEPRFLCLECARALRHIQIFCW